LSSHGGAAKRASDPEVTLKSKRASAKEFENVLLRGGESAWSRLVKRKGGKLGEGDGKASPRKLFFAGVVRRRKTIGERGAGPLHGRGISLKKRHT